MPHRPAQHHSAEDLNLPPVFRFFAGFCAFAFQTPFVFKRPFNHLRPAIRPGASACQRTGRYGTGVGSSGNTSVGSGVAVAVAVGSGVDVCVGSVVAVGQGVAVGGITHVSVV